MDIVHGSCDISGRIPPGVELLPCSTDRRNLRDLSLLRTKYPMESLGLIISKRLGIRDGELKATEWMTVCGKHAKKLVEYCVVAKDLCGICSGIKSLKRVSARNQDALGGKLMVGDKICEVCFRKMETSRRGDQMPTGQIWVHLDNDFRFINSSVPSLRLLCRGLYSNEPLYTPPELTVKDTIEIRRSLGNTNQANKEFLTDKMFALSIIPSFSEFRSTADASIKMLQSILSGDNKITKAQRFLGLKLSSLAFLPDENKNLSSKLEHFAFVRNGDDSCRVFCLACDRDDCTGCQRPSYPAPVSLGDSLGRHLHYLQSTCRVCKNRTLSFHSHPRGTFACTSNNCKHSYCGSFKKLWGVNVEEEDLDVYPMVVCRNCRSLLNSYGSPSRLPPFKPHNEDSFCDCDFTFLYANANVMESVSCLSVVINFSRIPSLGYLSVKSLASSLSFNLLTVKVALEIYQTFMLVHNKKSSDCFEYFKNLALTRVLASPIKLAFHHKANSFQSVLTLLCEASSHASRENRSKYRKKVDIILNADFHRTEPFLRSSKKIIKFRINFSVFSMCVNCSDLLCEGLCAEKRGRTPKKTLLKYSNNNHRKKAGKFEFSLENSCPNCPRADCKGCCFASNDHNHNLRNDHLKSTSPPSSSSSSPGPSKMSNNSTSDFFSHCPDCQFYFRREHIYLKHLETCSPGMTSLICSTCSRHFRSELGMLKHSCEGISRLENHQYKNLALNLGPLDYLTFLQTLLNPSFLPDPWTAILGSKKETLIIQKKGTPFEFLISRYRSFENKARLKGEGVKAFKEEVWAFIHQEEEFKCPGCHLDTFSSLIELDDHQIDCEDYQNAGSSFECDGCGKPFSHETNYIDHIKSCELIEIPEDIRSLYPDEWGRIFCPGCSQLFVDDEVEYFRHLKMCHLVEFQKFSCKSCDSRFSTTKTLKSHSCTGITRGGRVPSATITSSKPFTPGGCVSVKRFNLSNSAYEPICKAGRFTCPLCELNFTLNQPYGNHVRNSECVQSSNCSVSPYRTIDVIRNKFLFASLILSSNKCNGSSTFLKIKYGQVPSLRLLVRGFSHFPKPPPPLSVHEALEIYQSYKKSIATGLADKHRLWEWVRLSFGRSFGDFESFETLVGKRRRTLSTLTYGLKTHSSPELWEHKIKTYLSVPFHDQFIEEASLAKSFQVLEYASKTRSLTLICLRCNDILCNGCDGNDHSQCFTESQPNRKRKLEPSSIYEDDRNGKIHHASRRDLFPTGEFVDMT